MLDIKNIFKRREEEYRKEKDEVKTEVEIKPNKRSKICTDGIALLLLTKMGIIEDVTNFYEIVITPLLLDEIKKQKNDNEPEAHKILNLIDIEKISIENVYQNKDLKQYGLYNIELEIVSHFLNGNCNFILSDDAIIKANREILKLKVVSTPAFVLNLFIQGIITSKQAIDAYSILRSERWFNEWIIDECIRRVKLGENLNLK